MGVLNVRQIIQRVCGRLGLPSPTSVVGNPDATIIQLLGVLNQFPEDLATRHSAYFNTAFFSDAGTLGQFVTKDTDTIDCPDPLPLAYIKWKWKSDKGLEYAEDFAHYERLVTSWLLSQDRPLLDLTTSGGRQYEVVAPSLNQRPWGFRRY